MITYRIRPELHIRREIGLYFAFGIAVYRGRYLLMRIPDVFTRRRQAMHFIALCNREQPEPIHLLNILDDVI